MDKAATTLMEKQGRLNLPLLERHDDRAGAVPPIDARFSEMARDSRYQELHRDLAADFAESDLEAWVLRPSARGAPAGATTDP